MSGDGEGAAPDDPTVRVDASVDAADAATDPRITAAAADDPLETGATRASHLRGPLFAVGTRIADRYRIEDTLGFGGMGIVYRAHDELVSTDVALKVLRSEIAIDQEFLQRFRNELLAARQVSHRHVVRIHDIGEHQGLYFMTMDFVAGRSLRDVLRAEGPLDLATASRWVRQIAEGLAEAHRKGIVHRDLKPANVLVDGAGDAYVTDFGVARSMATPGLTRTGEVLGTPDYLSPEQARGEEVDGKSDVYTLGILFVEMLSGKLPFPRGSLVEVLAQRMTGRVRSLKELGVEVPPATAVVIDRMLAKDRERRYTADEVVAALAGSGPSWRRRLRDLRRPLAAVVVVALVAGLGSYALSRWRSRATAPPPPAAEAAATDAAAVPVARAAVAVLPFADTTGDAGTAATVAELLARSLAESEDLRVVDSVRVFQLLEDLGLEPARLRTSDLEDLARLLEVDRLVTGSLRRLGDAVQVEARLVDAAAPAEAAPVATVTGAGAELFTALGTLADALRRALAVAPAAEDATPATASPAAMAAYGEALAALGRHDAEGAIAHLERTVAADPEFTTAWLRLAELLRFAGRQDEALDAARAAVRASADDGGRLARRAAAEEALVADEPAEALALLGELVREHPHDVEARLVLAEAFEGTGDLAAAARELDVAAEIDPQHPRAWYLRGRVAIKDNRARQALDHLHHALGLYRALGDERGAADVHNALGVAALRLERPAEAAEAYREALAVRRRIGDRRGEAVALENLGGLAMASGDLDGAEARVREAIALYRDLGNPAGVMKMENALGSIAEGRGDMPRALEHYRRALEASQTTGNAGLEATSHNDVGFTSYVMGEYSDARLHIEKALALFTGMGDPFGEMQTLQNLAFVALAQGSWRDALDHLVRALDIARELGVGEGVAVSQGGIGRVAHLQGRYGAALAATREARSLVGDEPRGRVQYALQEAAILVDVGDFAAAGRLLEEVESWLGDGGSHEQTAELLAVRGDWHVRQGQADRAAEVLGRALVAAEASQSVTAAVEARLALALARVLAGEASAGLEAVRAAAAEADRLGNVVLQLRAAEALAEALVWTDRAPAAEEVVAAALRRVPRGGYGRAFRLHRLRARAFEATGDTARAATERAQARAELARLRQELPVDLRPRFEALPEVRALSASGAGSEEG